MIGVDEVSPVCYPLAGLSRVVHMTSEFHKQWDAKLNIRAIFKYILASILLLLPWPKQVVKPPVLKTIPSFNEKSYKVTLYLKIIDIGKVEMS